MPRTQKDKNPNGQGGSVTVLHWAKVASGPLADQRKKEEGRERLGLEGGFEGPAIGCRLA